jgi:hypothetical protein
MRTFKRQSYNSLKRQGTIQRDRLRLAQEAVRAKKERNKAVRSAMRYQTLQYFIGLMTLWATCPEECIIYLKTLPRDAFATLSTDEGLQLLWFLFHSARVEGVKIIECLKESSLHASLNRLSENLGRGCGSCSCLAAYRAPTCSLHTTTISNALKIFPSLFQLGLPIGTKYIAGYAPPCYDLAEKVIYWILTNSTHIEPVTVRNLYRPFLRHHREQSDGFTFLMSLVDQMFESPRETEEYNSVPIRIEFLMELLPVLELPDFVDGNNVESTCPAMIIIKELRGMKIFAMLHDLFYKREISDFNEKNTEQFLPGAEDLEEEYVVPRWIRAPWYKKQLVLWQHIVFMLRSPGYPRRFCASLRIHRFWRDVCYNPAYAFARRRVHAQFAQLESG